MSAPQTDPEKDVRRHWGPLVGMALVVVFAVALILYWAFEEVATSDPPPVQDQSAPLPATILPKPGGAAAP